MFIKLSGRTLQRSYSNITTFPAVIYTAERRRLYATRDQCGILFLPEAAYNKGDISRLLSPDKFKCCGKATTRIQACWRLSCLTAGRNARILFLKIGGALQQP